MATPQHHYWSPLRAEASPPPLGLLAGRRAAASRSFAAASPSATIVVRLHGRAHSADVTDAAAPRPLAGDYGDLGSSNLALALPTRLPAVSPASALAQEAERLAQDQQGRPRPLLLGELAVAVAQRQAEVTDALWAALLNLHKADKGATPSALERFFRVAEEIAPLGCMGHTQVALSLTSVYGAKIGRRWAALTSTGIGSGVLAGASLGPRNPRDSGVSGEGDMSDEGDGRVVRRIVDERTGLNLVGSSPRQGGADGAAGSASPGIASSSSPIFLKLDANAMIAFLARSGGRKASASAFLMSAIRQREREKVLAATGPTPTFSSPLPLLSAVPSPDFAALWRDVWLGLTVATNLRSESSPERLECPPLMAQTLTVAAHSGALGLSFDLRLLRGALAMIGPFKSCHDPRVALSAALRAVASYNGALLISRRDAEAVTCMAVRSTRDRQRAADALSSAFVVGLTTPLRDGFTSLDAGLPLATVLGLVLPSRALDAVLAPHPACDPRLPVSPYEMMLALPLRFFIAKRKAKLARALAGRSLLDRARMRPWWAALQRSARISRALRTLGIRVELQRVHRGVERLRSCFYEWRRAAVLLHAAIRLQGFGRIVLAGRTQRRDHGRKFLSRRLRTLWLCHRGLSLLQASRRARLRAALDMQRLFRGFCARKRLAQLAAERDRGEALAARRKAQAAVRAREQALMAKLALSLSRFRRRRALWRSVKVLAAQAREQRRLRQAVAEIEEAVAISRERRRRLDYEAAHFGKAARKRHEQAQACKHALGRRAAVDELVPSYLANAALAKLSPALAVVPNSLLVPVQLRDLPSEALVAPLLLRFFRRLVLLARLRRILQECVERHYDLASASYTYFDVRRHPAARMAGRPRLLGPFHELAVPDLWAVVTDARVAAGPRAGTGSPAPHGVFFFNMRFHSVAWHQPAGTLMCRQCVGSQAFADAHCVSCGVNVCGHCLQEHSSHSVLHVCGGSETAAAELVEELRSSRGLN